jgi:hypothetical protein
MKGKELMGNESRNIKYFVSSSRGVGFGGWVQIILITKEDFRKHLYFC